MAGDAPKLTEKDLHHWKLVADFQARLQKQFRAQPPQPAWEHHNRRLEQLDYLSLLLMGLVNPTLRTLRALSEASHVQRVQEEVCTRPASLASLSEAQHLLEPSFLEKLIESLSREINGQPKPTDPKEAWQRWLARDSSIFRATSRMVWAQHGAGKAGQPNHAVRLHVSFHVWTGQPTAVAVSPGKVCERKVWREQLEAGATYVGDRYFAEDYKMFGRLQERGCQFVLRLREEAVLEVVEDRPVEAAARQQGVLHDQWVHLGSRARTRTARLRVLTVRKSSGVTMRLVTNIPPEQMSSEEIRTLYRRRWTVEGYFRWLKCLLGCRHWLLQSAPGVTTQLYLAVIAGLLLQLVLGQRPNQRLWERLQLYLQGWATLDELMQAVQKAREKARAKKIQVA